MILSPEKQTKLDTYPLNIRGLILELRELVFMVAKEDHIDKVEECLKWGELAYVTKHGSTLRIDWKPNQPGEYAMYFHCQTRLVETFRELYPDTFSFDKNRAILFKSEQPLPIPELKHCISLCLRYHQIKNLPLLGA